MWFDSQYHVIRKAGCMFIHIKRVVDRMIQKKIQFSKNYSSVSLHVIGYSWLFLHILYTYIQCLDLMCTDSFILPDKKNYV